eukprot:TRINITY_DN24964_c0_g1_i1.p1 TRINITY_DN24964_c0_g1~~TRINITY_DN24964_c0_g1_i1.p1  ORF type:complete len:377 (-),score=50.12 TRINITY_DN24964_c0_g1_i1:14-1144(-)
MHRMDYELPFGNKPIDEVNNKSFKWAELPSEIQSHILSILTVSEQANAARISKEFRDHIDWIWNIRKEFITIVPKGLCPGPRVCHLSFIFGSKVYVIGGHMPSARNYYITEVFKDIWEFDITTRTWMEVAECESLSESNGVLHGDKFIFFGGFTGVGDKRTNSIFCFDLASKQISIFESASLPENSPCIRSVCSVCLYNGHLYIFGGWNVKTVLNDVWKFDLETYSWTLVKQKPNDVVPPPVRYHVAVVYKDAMYIYSGFTDARKHLDDLYRFDFATETWSLINTTGNKPKPRSRSRALVAGNKMYLVGGHDMNRMANFSDIYELNLDTFEWKEIHTANTPSLCQHTCDIVHDKTLVLFGGYNRGPTNALYSLRLI